MKQRQWVISDTHFNHPKQIENWYRPKDYEQLIINNWKKLINENDIVYFVWDVIMQRESELKDILSDLPWYKILIKGNHDNKKNLWYLNNWFDEVYDSYQIYYDWLSILFTHIPCDNEWYDISIHWHLHRYNEKNHRHTKDFEYLNLNSRVYSCEYENYKPIELKNIISNSHKSARIALSNSKKWLLWYLYLFKINIPLIIFKIFFSNNFDE